MIFTTLNTIVEDILKIIRGSIINSTEPISRRQIEDWVHQYRALLIKQDLDKGYYPNPDYIQELNNLLVNDEASQGDFKTELKIPKTLDLRYKNGITWVGRYTPGNNTVYEHTLIPQSRFFWSRFKRYSFGENYAYLEEGYMHITNPGITPAFISIKGVFENPMEVMLMNNPSVNGDFPYPIPNNKLPVLKKMILETELKIEAVVPSDVTNDDKHNPKPV